MLAEQQDGIAHANRQITELDRRIREIESVRLKRSDVNVAFGNFDDVWNTLSPREQAQVLTLLIARVEFDAEDSSIAVTFHPSAIKALAEDWKGDAA